MRHWLIGSCMLTAACGPPRVPEPDRTEGTVQCVKKEATCPAKEGALLTPPGGYRLVSVDNGPVEQDNKCCYGVTIERSESK